MWNLFFSSSGCFLPFPLGHGPSGMEHINDYNIQEWKNCRKPLYVENSTKNNFDYLFSRYRWQFTKLLRKTYLAPGENAPHGSLRTFNMLIGERGVTWRDLWMWKRIFIGNYAQLPSFFDLIFLIKSQIDLSFNNWTKVSNLMVSWPLISKTAFNILFSSNSSL